MRISTHGNDLLVTDQSVGFGALLVAGGVLLVTNALVGMLDGFTLGSVVSLLLGAMAIKTGLERLVATQLIIDPDAKMVITKRWSFTGSDEQRIPYSAITGFSIEPEGQVKRTVLMIQTSRGAVPATGGAKGERPAWEEIVAAVETHMGRRPKADDQTKVGHS